MKEQQDEGEQAEAARHYFSAPERQEAMGRLIDALAEQVAKDYLAGKDPGDRVPVRLTKQRKSTGPAIRMSYPPVAKEEPNRE